MTYFVEHSSAGHPMRRSTPPRAMHCARASRRCECSIPPAAPVRSSSTRWKHWRRSPRRRRPRTVSDRRRAVLTRSIFGVDINPTAVWLCELRLWLSVVTSPERGWPLAKMIGRSSSTGHDHGRRPHAHLRDGGDGRPARSHRTARPAARGTSLIRRRVRRSTCPHNSREFHCSEPPSDRPSLGEKCAVRKPSSFRSPRTINRMPGSPASRALALPRQPALDWSNGTCCAPSPRPDPRPLDHHTPRRTGTSRRSDAGTRTIGEQRHSSITGPELILWGHEEKDDGHEPSARRSSSGRRTMARFYGDTVWLREATPTDADPGWLALSHR